MDRFFPRDVRDPALDRFFPRDVRDPALDRSSTGRISWLQLGRRGSGQLERTPSSRNCKGSWTIQDVTWRTSTFASSLSRLRSQKLKWRQLGRLSGHRRWWRRRGPISVCAWLVVMQRATGLQEVSDLNLMALPLHFTLALPFGTARWHPDLRTEVCYSLSSCLNLHCTTF